jgi:hypothetical protein
VAVKSMMVWPPRRGAVTVEDLAKLIATAFPSS